MKHLTLFQTEAEYNSATLELPNVSFIEENTVVKYNPNNSKLKTIELIGSEIIGFNGTSNKYIPQNYFIKEPIISWEISPKDDIKLENIKYLCMGQETPEGNTVLINTEFTSETCETLGFYIDYAKNTLSANSELIYSLNANISMNTFVCVFFAILSPEGQVIPINTVYKYELA